MKEPERVGERRLSAGDRVFYALAFLVIAVSLLFLDGGLAR